MFDKELIKPLYLFLITIISCFLLTKYKENHKYKSHKSLIFTLGIIFIIFSEMSANYFREKFNKHCTFYILPLIIIFAYIILRNKLIFRKNQMIAIYQKNLINSFLNPFL